MSPTTIARESERGRRARSPRSDDDDSQPRHSRHSPSPHRRPKRRSTSPDERSAVKKDYKMDSSAHRSRRGDHADASPPPAKRRRRSEERLDDPSRRERKHDRSRSPYRCEKEKRRREDDRRRRSRSPYSKDKDGRSGRRRDEVSKSKSRSPARRKSHRDYSASPPRRKDRKERRSRSRSRSRDRKAHPKSRAPLPSQEVAFHGEGNGENGAVDKPIVKEKPNFKPTGLLAKEANTVAGTKIVLKYNEPPEARKPPAPQKWQLYVFKGNDIVDEIPLYTQSCWLLGREQAVADVHIEHPSASKQHCVIQFRHSVKVNEFGDKTNIVRPYIIDLESANGTMLNGEKVKDSRYYEIRDKDMVKIGHSDREYVFMLPASA